MENNWLACLVPPAFKVRVGINAGDTFCSCQLPAPLPVEETIIRYVWPPLQTSVNVTHEIKDSLLTFKIPLAMPNPILFEAVVFIYTPQQIEQLKAYAKELGEHFNKQPIKPILLCE